MPNGANDTYSCNLKVALTATQTIATDADSVATPRITHSKFAIDRLINDRSANPITLASHKLHLAVDTTGVEIDLTALPDFNGGIKNATGKQLYAVYLLGKTAGKKATLSAGATNGYPIGTGSGTDQVATPVSITIVKTQTGIIGTQPAKWTVTIPTTANAGYVALYDGQSLGGDINRIPYNAAPIDIRLAFAMARGALPGEANAVTRASYTCTNPSTGVFLVETVANEDPATPAILHQEMYSINSGSLSGSLLVHGLEPTAMLLGPLGSVVDSTHKKLKLAALADTMDVAVTLWFCDAV